MVGQRTGGGGPLLQPIDGLPKHLGPSLPLSDDSGAGTVTLSAEPRGPTTQVRQREGRVASPSFAPAIAAHHAAHSVRMTSPMNSHPDRRRDRPLNSRSVYSRLLEVDQMKERIEQSVWVCQSEEVPSRNDVRVHADALS
jgi:hypothetical protein